MSQDHNPLNIGLLVHVGASRRAPHFYSFIPGSKTGDFSISIPCKASVNV